MARLREVAVNIVDWPHVNERAGHDPRQNGSLRRLLGRRRRTRTVGPQPRPSTTRSQPKGATMPAGNAFVWTVVGVLAVIALIIWIAPHIH